MTPTITNEQLEAWASLGPWEWQKLAEFSSPKHSLGPGVLLTDERDGTPWGDTIDQINAALIAAAPKLAAALLAERKAREVEVAKLKAAIQDIAENWKWWDEDRYDRCSSVVGDSIAEADQALKGQRDEV